VLRPALATDVMSLPVLLLPIRLRKFIGTVALFALVIVWALVAMAVAQAPLIHDSTAASIAYYVIAGLGWVLPAMPIVSWMSRRTDYGRRATEDK
jgi:Protein of unknown function (DUF2842)